MIFLTLITASLLAGTIGLAIADDPLEEESGFAEEEATLSNGDDDFRGTVGTDETSGQDGDDLLSSYFSNDTLDGGAGDDTIAGGAESDIINGAGGADVLSGGTGDDQVFGDSDDDRVFGGFGNDEVWGGEGDDFVAGDEGDDLVVGGRGTDTLRGGRGDDVLIGADIFREDIERDELSDTTLQNVILYQDDIDEGDAINADEGDDLIIVGSGDIVLSGSGEDIVQTGTWVQGDLPTFTDFDPDNDRIYVSVDLATTEFNLEITANDGDAIVSVDGMDVLRVLGGAGVVTDNHVDLSLNVLTDRPA